jgi:hypothetical protein
MEARIRQHAPFEWYNNRGNIQAALEQDFPKEKEVYQSRYTANDFPYLPRVMKDWVDAYINQEAGLRPKTLVV